MARFDSSFSSTCAALAEARRVHLLANASTVCRITPAHSVRTCLSPQDASRSSIGTRGPTNKNWANHGPRAELRMSSEQTIKAAESGGLNFSQRVDAPPSTMALFLSAPE